MQGRNEAPTWHVHIQAYFSPLASTQVVGLPGGAAEGFRQRFGGRLSHSDGYWWCPDEEQAAGTTGTGRRSGPLPASRYGPKVGEPELLGDGFPVPVEVPASPGLLATDHFELGSGIDVSTDAPGFVAPHEVQDLVGGHEGSTSIPSDGTACGAPLKSDRAIIPPYSSVSLLSRFDNISNEPVGSGMAHLPDLPEDAVVVNWLLGGAGVDMEDIVFSIDGREARWDDLLSWFLEIIDNASAPTTNKEKYGESLEDMQDMLSEFYNKVHNGRSILCAGLVPKRMQMAWCDSRNKIDCGVYLMRHMESFLGQGVLDWDCGLVKEEYSTLHKLKLQYMKELVVSEYNLHKGWNLSRAYQSIGGPIAS
nr:zinc finger BED domain-containing protein RICESLEEPER 2-like [Ipomoea batatas]